MSAAIAGEAAVRGSTVQLASGALLKLHAPRGMQLTVEAGQLWITEEDQPDDVWVATGQRVRLVGDGLAVIEAKGDARLRLD